MSISPTPARASISAATLPVAPKQITATLLWLSFFWFSFPITASWRVYLSSIKFLTALLVKKISKMAENKFSEIKRQALHAAMGIVLVILLSNQLINTWHLFWLLIVGSLLAFLSKRIRIPIISWILDHCERPEQRKTFPGRGPVFFVLGSLLALKLFPFDAAFASILIFS